VRSSSASVVFAALTVVTMFTLAGFQVTNETAGVRLLGRIGAAMIELDRWLPAHRDDIELLSRDRPNAPLILPDLPVQVAIPSTAVIDASDASLRASISRSMGEVLYAEGAGAVTDEEGESHLGVTEPVRWAINLLGEDSHGFWRIALIVTGLSLLVLSAGLFWTRQAPFMALASGGAISGVLALGIWLLALILGSSMDGAIDREIALALRDGAWIGLRNGLALFAIGLAASFVASSLRGPRRDDWEDWDGYEYDDEYEQEPTRAPPY
jgi:hypothetical protein